MGFSNSRPAMQRGWGLLHIKSVEVCSPHMWKFAEMGTNLHVVHEGFWSLVDVIDLHVTFFSIMESWSLHGQFPLAPFVSAEVDLRPARRVLAR
ncbi:hypothetical protein TNCV_5108081 [Trichonephila clavipes]|nr:hypothetical protein TNCV_5108081 [Trichonephila clavipes]